MSSPLGVILAQYTHVRMPIIFAGIQGLLNGYTSIYVPIKSVDHI